MVPRLARDELTQGVGHDRRERLLGVDRPVLDLPDQGHREVHVELLDLLADARMLAS